MDVLRIGTAWRRALDAGQRALEAAAACVPAVALGEHRNELRHERELVAALLGRRLR